MVLNSFCLCKILFIMTYAIYFTTVICECHRMFLQPKLGRIYFLLLTLINQFFSSAVFCMSNIYTFIYTYRNSHTIFYFAICSSKCITPICVGNSVFFVYYNVLQNKHSNVIKRIAAMFKIMQYTVCVNSLPRFGITV